LSSRSLSQEIRYDVDFRTARLLSGLMMHSVLHYNYISIIWSRLMTFVNSNYGCLRNSRITNVPRLFRCWILHFSYYSRTDNHPHGISRNTRRFGRLYCYTSIREQYTHQKNVNWFETL